MNIVFKQYMKKFLLGIASLFYVLTLSGQSQLDTLDISEINFLERVIIDGDTLLVADIEEVYILPPKKFKNKRERRRYSRLIRNVKKVYPYAQIAREFFDSVNSQLVHYEKERDKKQYIKSVENELLAGYEDDLKKLTISQGRILLKLIDRELDSAPYALIKEYRGDFSAVFWQTIARIFGNNLKDRYDPDGEDKSIDEIVRMIEMGAI